MLVRKKEFNNDWDYLFEHLFRSPTINERRGNKLIKFKSDDGDRYVMAVPGLQKNNLKISVEGNILSVSYDLSERDESIFIEKKFSERIFLSNNANTDKIVPTLRDGILTIEIPRVSEIKKIKTIEVR